MSTSVTPDGNVPVLDSDGFGNPVVVIVNVPAWFVVNVVLFALVIDGASLIVSVKFCGALEPCVFVAVNVIG